LHIIGEVWFESYLIAFKYKYLISCNKKSAIYRIQKSLFLNILEDSFGLLIYSSLIDIHAANVD